MNPIPDGIMSLEESRPRGTVLDERADRLCVGEACLSPMQGMQRLCRRRGITHSFWTTKASFHIRRRMEFSSQMRRPARGVARKVKTK
jgi:hypothetical protein